MAEKKRSRFTGVVFLLIGLAAVLISIYDFVGAYATTKWPTVTGIIGQSAIRTETDKGMIYCPSISWTYRVQGINYTSTNDPFCTSRSAAQAEVAKFPTGARVNVSYSPQDPGESTLEPGKPRFPIFILIIGVIFIGIALFNF